MPARTRPEATPRTWKQLCADRSRRRQVARHGPCFQPTESGSDTHRRGKPIPYDFLVLATGAAMRPDEIPGLAANANTIWSPEEMMRLRASLDDVLERAKAGSKSRVRFLVPPNNKCSGPLYEMVMMLDSWLTKKGARGQVDIGHLTYEKGYIQAFGPRLDEVVTAEFARRGISGRKGAVVARVDAGLIRLEDGSSEAFDVLISFPPYVAATRFEGLEADARGFLITDPKTRQLKGQPDVYAVGDGGDFPVKQAFLALLQADAAAEHLAERILGEEPTAVFDPVSMWIMDAVRQGDVCAGSASPHREEDARRGYPGPVHARSAVPRGFDVGRDGSRSERHGLRVQRLTVRAGCRSHHVLAKDQRAGDLAKLLWHAVLNPLVILLARLSVATRDLRVRS